MMPQQNWFIMFCHCRFPWTLARRSITWMATTRKDELSRKVKISPRATPPATGDEKRDNEPNISKPSGSLSITIRPPSRRMGPHVTMPAMSTRKANEGTASILANCWRKPRKVRSGLSGLVSRMQHHRRLQSHVVSAPTVTTDRCITLVSADRRRLNCDLIVLS